ncbi:MAG: hypothetical protein LBD75_04980, partial [Candidatus Peribacteria bacterium]|nr:hypothetical protein [Candidatus Peribacteria bacterium]
GLYINNQTGTYGLYVDGTGRNYFAGNVGIGTTPSSSYKTYIYNSTSDHGLYINNQTGTYGLFVGGIGRNYFAGNVGIGTIPSSSYRLEVSGSGNFS